MVWPDPRRSAGQPHRSRAIVPRRRVRRPLPPRILAIHCCLSLLAVTCVTGIIIILLTMHPYRFPTDSHHPPTLVYATDGTLLAKFSDEYRVPVRLDDLSSDTVHAVLAAEDLRFFKHRGVDAKGIGRAVWANLRAGSLRQGGSTITQQLVRLELLNDQRTFRRKANEIILALRVERAYAKCDILERYINDVYFGGGAYGIEAASRSYFRKHARDLTPAESALLAGLIRAPSEGNPRAHLTTAIRRQQTVLATMRRQGWLSEKTYARARSAPVRIAPRLLPRVRWRAPYAVEMVRIALLDRYGPDMLYHGGMRVYTTIDPRLQIAAEQALAMAVRQGQRRHVGNGALIALDPSTGAIRALVGGTDYWHSQFNRVTQAHRQPGSCFKPFVYLAALKHGMLPTDQELDAPFEFGLWQPENYGQHYHGRVMIHTALALSLNSVAVRLTDEVGLLAVIDAAHQAGIQSELPINLGISLGVDEVTPLEMARAFATFANGGEVVTPYLVREVRFGGRKLAQAPKTRRTLDAVTAFLLTDALQRVISEGTGRAARIGRPAAGKTGTSNDFRDAWFVGYTPQLCAAVWMGNDNHRPMAGVAGGSLPAQAWAGFMRSAMRGQPRLDFTVPPGVTRVQVDRETSIISLPDSKNLVSIYLPTDRVPGRMVILPSANPAGPNASPNEDVYDETIDEVPPDIQTGTMKPDDSGIAPPFRPDELSQPAGDNSPALPILPDTSAYDRSSAIRRPFIQALKGHA